MRWLGYFLIAGIVLAAGIYAAFQWSPWPSVWLIRDAFAKDGSRVSEALARHVPAGIGAMLDEPYGPAPAERLDVFLPPGAEAGEALLPAVVWVHGGGFVAGDKAEIANYLRILAGRGFVTVGVNYTRAPDARYPTPVRQANAALAFVIANAARFRIDPERLVLAGDSAGAQIAAQVAATVTDRAYASATGIAAGAKPGDIRGVALFCGVFDAAGLAGSAGGFAGFLRTVSWAYFGKKDLTDDPRLAEFSIEGHLAPGYPPAFISAGNADPLAPQSASLAAAMTARGLAVETFFFPADRQPPLGHEYQFKLDDPAGPEALERLVAFLGRATEKPAR